MRQKKVQPECTVEDCTKRNYSRGWCKMHYERMRLRGTLDPLPRKPKTNVGPCKACDRPAQYKGLCSGHYQQQAKGRPLTPIRTQRILPKDEHGRVCTGCDRYKTWDNFYINTDGNPRSKCNECMIRYSVEWQQANKEKYHEYQRTYWYKRRANLTNQ